MLSCARNVSGHMEKRVDARSNPGKTGRNGVEHSLDDGECCLALETSAGIALEKRIDARSNPARRNDETGAPRAFITS